MTKDEEIQWLCGLIETATRAASSSSSPAYVKAIGDLVKAYHAPEREEERVEDPDEWSERIFAAYPTQSGSHEEYGVAMRMVENRHRKGELVALVNWLLLEVKREKRGSRR